MAKLHTSTDTLYLVSSVGDSSKALYRPLKGKGNESAILIKIFNKKSCIRANHSWPEILSIEKCRVYGRRVTEAEMFVDCL